MSDTQKNWRDFQFATRWHWHCVNNGNLRPIQTSLSGLLLTQWNALLQGIGKYNIFVATWSTGCILKHNCS